MQRTFNYVGFWDVDHWIVGTVEYDRTAQAPTLSAAVTALVGLVNADAQADLSASLTPFTVDGVNKTASPEFGNPIGAEFFTLGDVDPPTSGSYRGSFTIAWDETS